MKKELRFDHVVYLSAKLKEKHKDSGTFPLVDLYKMAAEYVRPVPTFFRYSPSATFEFEGKEFIENADNLMESAEEFFKNRFCLHNICLLKLEPMEAVPQENNSMNFEEFKGGMLELIKEMHQENPEDVGRMFFSEETDALNAVTWTYHFARKRTPLSYFEIKE